MRAARFALAAALALAPAAARAGEPIKTEERRTTALAGAFADVAAKVAPSVVEVWTAAGDQLGTGVAIEDGSYVLTSRSILGRATDNHVELRRAGQPPRYASILGRNEGYDVALLRLQTRGASLPALALGKSGALAVGQWVISVGTSPGRPLGVGVVSALGRRVEPRAEADAIDIFGVLSESPGPARAYARVIHHDAPVDADQLGAPLVDADGGLVGINVAKAYRGSGYAAPIDEVAAFLDDLKAGRDGPAAPKPGFIGVALGAISDREVAKALGIPGPGVQIHEVPAGRPAAKAGLRKGDVVLAVEGEKVASAERFGQIIRGTLPGATVVIRVRRGAEDVDVPVVVGERASGDE
jgi:serine protease Do